MSDTEGKPADSPGKKRKSGDLASLATDLPVASGKRERKSIEKFEADNFAEKKEVTIAKGRGVPLGTIESVAEAIRGSKMKGSDLAIAHNLCFGGRAKDRAKKPQLLEFSGYLPPAEAGADEAAQEKLDEPYEVSARLYIWVLVFIVNSFFYQGQDAHIPIHIAWYPFQFVRHQKKIGDKAYKMTNAGLKRMCDFFDIDRSAKGGETVGKDFLTDKLLNFLAAPDEKLTKDYVKNKKKKEAAAARKAEGGGGSKNKSKKVDDFDDDGAEEDFEEVDGKRLPTDKALRKWVRAYIRCFNLDKVTAKTALATASDKFGVDLIERKRRLKELLAEEMSNF